MSRDPDNTESDLEFDEETLEFVPMHSRAPIAAPKPKPPPPFKEMTTDEQEEEMYGNVHNFDEHGNYLIHPPDLPDDYVEKQPAEMTTEELLVYDRKREREDLGSDDEDEPPAQRKKKE